MQVRRVSGLALTRSRLHSQSRSLSSRVETCASWRSTSHARQIDRTETPGSDESEQHRLDPIRGSARLPRFVQRGSDPSCRSDATQMYGSHTTGLDAGGGRRYRAGLSPPWWPWDWRQAARALADAGCAVGEGPRLISARRTAPASPSMSSATQVIRPRRCGSSSVWRGKTRGASSGLPRREDAARRSRGVVAQR